MYVLLHSFLCVPVPYPFLSLLAESGRPKGFGFVEFENGDDADEAIYQLDRREFGGREMTVVLAKEGRKPADQMRGKFGTGGGYRDGDRGYRGGGGGGGRRRSRSRDRGGRGRSRSRSRSRSRDNRRRGRSPFRSRSRSRSPLGGRSPPSPRSRSRTRSPEGMSPGTDNGGGEPTAAAAAAPAPAGERSRTRSPAMEHAGEEA